MDNLTVEEIVKRRRYLRASASVFYVIVLLAFAATMNADFIPISPFVRVISGCIAVPAIPAVCVFILIRGFRSI